MTRGLVLGKFMPPHAGHLRLVHFALNMCGELDIVVASSASDPIAGSLRVDWMRAACPAARVMHLTDPPCPHPDAHPTGHAAFWSEWRASLLRCLGGAPDRVFASEPYGARLAKELAAQFVPLDREDGVFPISGSEILKDPWAHWAAIAPPARSYFLRRVHIVGPESVGKSTLARRLAQHFETVWVPEYARTWLLRNGATVSAATVPITAEDMPIIAAGHRASAKTLEGAARKIIFLDTDALTTRLWSEELFGEVTPSVAQAAKDEAPDLTLLLDADAPWVADAVRYLPTGGAAFFGRCRAALEEHGRTYIHLDGTFDDRFEAARHAVAALSPPAQAQDHQHE